MALPLPVVLVALRLPCFPFEVEEWPRPVAITPTEPESSRRVDAPEPTPFPWPEALVAAETAHYVIRYGLLGTVGDLRLSLGGRPAPEAPQDQPQKRGPAPRDGGLPALRAEGEGEGAVLGFGRIHRRVESEFDPKELRSRRWKIQRTRGKETVVDIAEQGGPDALTIERHRSGVPATRHGGRFPQPTSDALGTLLRLRAAPPRPGETLVLHALDGLALWRVEARAVGSAEPVPGAQTTGLLLVGEVIPVFASGARDPERPVRSFKLWLSTDPSHVPLRMEVPLGPASMVIALTELRRSAPMDEAQQPVNTGASASVSGSHSVSGSGSGFGLGSRPRGCAGRPHLVADVTHGLDHRASRTQLGAQPPDVNVDRSRPARVPVSPHPR